MTEKAIQRLNAQIKRLFDDEHDPAKHSNAERAALRRERQALYDDVMPLERRLNDVWRRLNQLDAPRPVRAVSLTYRTAFLITGATPAAWTILVFALWMRRRRRIREGHCPACGYDLRATPERCPECGQVADGSKKPTVK